jgi:hypothetical protein
VHAAQGLAALQPRVQALLGRLGSGVDALVAAAPDQATGSGGRWDVRDRIGLRGDVFGAREPLWLDALLPVVSVLLPGSCSSNARVHTAVPPQLLERRESYDPLARCR